MNLYYQMRIGLDMGYFWKRNLPVLLTSAAVIAICLGGSVFAPVQSWISFITWGAAYTILFIIAMWAFVLDKDEKAFAASKLPFLG